MGFRVWKVKKNQKGKKMVKKGDSKIFNNKKEH